MESNLRIILYVLMVLYTLYWAFAGRLLVHRFTCLIFLWNSVERWVLKFVALVQPEGGGMLALLGHSALLQNFCACHCMDFGLTLCPSVWHSFLLKRYPAPHGPYGEWLTYPVTHGYSPSFLWQNDFSRAFGTSMKPMPSLTFPID